MEIVNNNKYPDENDIKRINFLCKIYFSKNPDKNKITFRIKAYDTIRHYLIDLEKSYDDLYQCLNLNQHNKYPIWTMLKIYFENKEKEELKKKINYRKEICSSTNPKDWL